MLNEFLISPPFSKLQLLIFIFALFHNPLITGYAEASGTRRFIFEDLGCTLIMVSKPVRAYHLSWRVPKVLLLPLLHWSPQMDGVQYVISQHKSQMTNMNNQSQGVQSMDLKQMQIDHISDKE